LIRDLEEAMHTFTTALIAGEDVPHVFFFITLKPIAEWYKSL